MSKRKPSATNVDSLSNKSDSVPLLDDLRQLIDEARRAATVAVNIGQTMLYWRVGKRIREDVLGQRRAGYGEEIVATLSRQLAAEYSRGFTEKNLRRMVQLPRISR